MKPLQTFTLPTANLVKKVQYKSLKFCRTRRTCLCSIWQTTRLVLMGASQFVNQSSITQRWESSTLATIWLGLMVLAVLRKCLSQLATSKRYGFQTTVYSLMVPLRWAKHYKTKSSLKFFASSEMISVFQGWKSCKQLCLIARQWESLTLLGITSRMKESKLL